MYISSDTNIWIDFYEVDHLEHPFRLGYDFCISSVTFEDELIKSEELRDGLLQNGLQRVDISDEELMMALDYQRKYRALSLYDVIALAIAKSRRWVLLSGDRKLRQAAEKENVDCHGVIWVYDELLDQGKITLEERAIAMQDLIDAVQTGRCRLPLDELKKRLI